MGSGSESHPYLWYDAASRLVGANALARIPPTPENPSMPRCFASVKTLAIPLASILLLAGCGASKNHAADAKLWLEFSGPRAFAHVEKIVALGPRPSGSPELETERLYLEDQLRATGWQVERQRFTDPTPRGPIEFINLIARRADATADTPRAIVCTHYDTKFFDTQRFVGANDGGSGTGALLELARVLSLDPGFAQRFELVFFDGEEAIREFRIDQPPFDGLYGSRHYARVLREDDRAKQFRLGVLWDMMGDSDLTITLPPDSPTKLARGIFDASDALGTRAHFSYFRSDLLDDHKPLNQAGIPTIDLIDFDFPAWHTPADTIDKVSPASLEIVGRATLYHLCKIAPEIR